jgi:uncharacterized ferredoxin-like protein
LRSGPHVEFLHAAKTLRDESAEVEIKGPTCNSRDIDLGTAVGSATPAVRSGGGRNRRQPREPTASSKSRGVL